MPKVRFVKMWKDVRESFVGKKIGSLLILSAFMKPVGTRQDNVSFVKCMCDCGKEKDIRLSSIKGETPSTTSCGCEREKKSSESRTKHGMYGTPTYKSWVAMKDRCSASSNKKAYAEVTVCDEWKSFKNFYRDMGDRPDGETIDRISSYGNYEKSNCRWADNFIQQRNVRVRVRTPTRTKMLTEPITGKATRSPTSGVKGSD